MLYRLIDGPFFYEMCKEACLIEGYTDFNIDLNAIGGAYRTIYYDALPVQKTGESEIEFQKKLEQKLDFLNSIRMHRDMQVKDGITRLKTPDRVKAASQRLEQKGVDTWIAVDAVKLALTAAANDIEIFTSDSDIYPAFDVIRETSAKSILRYQIGRAASELIYSADWARPFGMDETLRMAGKRNGSVSGAGGIIQFDTKLELEQDGLVFALGRAGDEFLVNFLDRNGAPRNLRASRLANVIDFLNQFGEPKPWASLAKELSALRQ